MLSPLFHVTKRDAAGIEPEDIKQSVVYTTSQTHCSIRKALNISGMGTCIKRKVPVDSGYRMRSDALLELIIKDKDEGLQPFLVVATCGTTGSGAIDPINEIGDICNENNVWLHVDGAYGGYFVLVDEIREKFKGIEKSDSIATDPHKTLFLPFGCSMVIVKNGQVVLQYREIPFCLMYICLLSNLNSISQEASVKKEHCT
jgi:aromatic-L-amino-acid/L-tryptophan decarboxylase